MAVVSVLIPEDLLERIDQFADDHGYTGRSEVLREASRKLMGEFEDKKLDGRELMGVVTVLFDYETTTVEAKMIHLRHEYKDTVASNFPTETRFLLIDYNGSDELCFVVRRIERLNLLTRLSRESVLSGISTWRQLFDRESGRFTPSEQGVCEP
ncbi:CopG family transcripitonal regulator [Halorubrum californiense DSM 19288]|uniref:CopG family transcripitonal regulator n=1 Tax=Halorubrum californiense DSM 19288 TaxID=1227465 RepID=M0ERM2_9EURY|nr:CopG family transcripitonal regulator [Halorubrum californiense DSM 19288]